MTIHEKLRHLTALSNKSAVAIAAGLSSSSLRAILRRRSALTTKDAVAFSQVLGVDVAWLIDDSKGLPPVRIEASLDANDPSTQLIDRASKKERGRTQPVTA
jgi:hypothetical protein